MLRPAWSRAASRWPRLPGALRRPCRMRRSAPELTIARARRGRRAPCAGRAGARRGELQAAQAAVRANAPERARTLANRRRWTPSSPRPDAGSAGAGDREPIAPAGGAAAPPARARRRRCPEPGARQCPEQARAAAARHFGASPRCALAAGCTAPAGHPALEQADAAVEHAPLAARACGAARRADHAEVALQEARDAARAGASPDQVEHLVYIVNQRGACRGMRCAAGRPIGNPDARGRARSGPRSDAPRESRQRQASFPARDRQPRAPAEERRAGAPPG